MKFFYFLYCIRFLSVKLLLCNYIEVLYWCINLDIPIKSIILLMSLNYENSINFFKHCYYSIYM